MVLIEPLVSRPIVRRFWLGRLFGRSQVNFVILILLNLIRVVRKKKTKDAER